jgi:pilus assembly protein CpaC
MINGFYKYSVFGVMFGLVAVCALAVPSSFAAKEDFITNTSMIQRNDPLMVLTVGKAEIVDIDGSVSDIMVADPDIVDVVALQSNRMYMVGAKVGNTNVIALDSDGNVVKRLNIHVRVDEFTLEETINDLFPDENIRARTVNDQVILVGEVSNPSVAGQIRDLATRFVGDENKLINLVKISGEMQVMLKVRVMEASRAVLKELGVESRANGRTGTGIDDLDSIPSGVGAAIGATSQTGLTSDPFGVGRLIYDTGINGIGFTEILVNALEEDKLINILAEPNLTAISGEEASFLAGGEFPIPTGRDNQGNIEIEFKPFGVSLNFRPTVLSERRISLQLKTEVSSLDPEEGITLAEITVPGLDVRRAETIVELNSGGSLMIAGMLKSETIKGVAGLPNAKRLPIIGDLIRSDSFNREETELLIIVTPYVVQPMAREAQARRVTADEHIEMPLAALFRTNLRRVYGARVPNLPELSERLGYLLD